MLFYILSLAFLFSSRVPFRAQKHHCLVVLSSGEQIIKILTRLSDLGLRSIELTGGEPTVHPDFMLILEFCLNNFNRVALLTNGTLLTEKIARLLGKFPGISLVQVDLDGSTAEEHEFHRPKDGAFSQTCKAIRFLVKHDVKTRIAMNVTKHNLYDIEATLLRAKDLGAKWFTYAPVVEIGRGKEIDMQFSKDELEHYVSLGSHLSDKYGPFLTYTDSERFEQLLREERNCGAGWRVMVLAPDGVVRPCPMLPEGVLDFGNLIEQDPEEVFSHPAIMAMYNLDRPNQEACGDCSHLYYCLNCFTRAVVTQSKLEEQCHWMKACGVGQFLNISEGNRKPACSPSRECAVS